CSVARCTRRCAESVVRIWTQVTPTFSQAAPRPPPATFSTPDSFVFFFKDSTRKLYEKKLEKAMKSAPVERSPDKTFYREEAVYSDTPPIQSSNRAANHSTVRSGELVRKPGGGVWKVIRLLLLLAVLAAFLYYSYCRLNGNENPFAIQ
ncbi:hypothetical protein FQN60_002135, partial [Etheostoma spectabile]